MQITTKSGRKLYLPSEAEDRAINDGIAADTDAQELDTHFFTQARPAPEMLGQETVTALVAKRGRGRPAGSRAESTKAQVTLRLDADVLQSLKATGRGWQTRVNALLRADIESGRLAKAP